MIEAIALLAWRLESGATFDMLRSMGKGYEENQARLALLQSFGKDLARRAKSTCERELARDRWYDPGSLVGEKINEYVASCSRFLRCVHCCLQHLWTLAFQEHLFAGC